MNKLFAASAIFGLTLASASVYAVENEAISAEQGDSIQAPATEQAEQPAAVQPEVAWKSQFQSLDKNKDGVIDRKEAKADKNLNKHFKSLAKKGKLDETGYMNWQKSQQPRG